jgi:hypothetical protein
MLKTIAAAMLIAASLAAPALAERLDALAAERARAMRNTTRRLLGPYMAMLWAYPLTNN